MSVLLVLLHSLYTHTHTIFLCTHSANTNTYNFHMFQAGQYTRMFGLFLDHHHFLNGIFKIFASCIDGFTEYLPTGLFEKALNNKPMFQNIIKSLSLILRLCFFHSNRLSHYLEIHFVKLFLFLLCKIPLISDL